MGLSAYLSVISRILKEFVELKRYLSVSWEEYARSIHAVLTSLGTGIDVNFSSRRLVGIGHSMGAISL